MDNPWPPADRQVDDKLTQRIRSMETHLLLVDHRPKLEQFVRDHRAAQAATVCVIQVRHRQSLDQSNGGTQPNLT